MLRRLVTVLFRLGTEQRLEELPMLRQVGNPTDAVNVSQLTQLHNDVSSILGLTGSTDGKFGEIDINGKLREVLSRQLLLVVAVADLYLLIIMSLTRTQVRMKLI